VFQAIKYLTVTGYVWMLYFTEFQGRPDVPLFNGVAACNKHE